MIGATATVALLAVALLAVVCVPSPVSAHGYLSTPPSRQAQCAKGAISGCGNIIYEPQSVEALKGLRSCNGGRADWAPLADESKAWPVTSLSAGVNTFRWTLTAVHATASWEYYIGSTRLALITGSSTTHSVNLAGYSGRQKILAIWNIGDTANAFYACADVNIAGGGGSTTPTSAPTSAPTTRPTTAPTTAPTTRPTTTPTTAPTTGTEWYTVRQGDSLGAIAASRRITLAALIAVNPEISDANLIYVSQRIRIPSKRAAGLNYTMEEATGSDAAGFGFTGSSEDTGVEITLTDNAIDLTSTGVGSHWYAGIQKALGANSASPAHATATPATFMLGLTVLSVACLLFGQS
jgi:predicted carbohydrate-binding protein with CBM5 and CBM33 domain